MRIAILASNFIRIPPEPEFIPQGYSGAPEKIMQLITDELVKRNHEVTLFASGDSETKAKLVSVSNKSSSQDSEIGKSHSADLEYLLISKCYEMAKNGEFDLIHSIFDLRSAYFAGLVSVPTVSTLHSPIGGLKKSIMSKIPDTQHYISISDNQRRSLSSLNYLSTIYHGIDISNFPFGDGSDESILSTGRIVPDKGVDQVISVANKIGKRCMLLGECPENNKEYWDSSIAPYIDNVNIFHKGLVEKKELIESYEKAKLFLFPIQWEEPFGLVMVEAMAAGTPVVAYARGSVPEVVRDGVSGFVVNSSEEDIRGDFIIKKTGIEGLTEAVERIYSMSEEEYNHMRKNCRRHVEDNFTIKKMIDGYEEAYSKILS